MATNVYLKKQLSTNVPRIFLMKKRAGTYPEKDFNTQQPTGKMETLYIFADDKGVEMKHYAKEREEETLSMYHPGDQVQVVLQEAMKEIDGKQKRISFLVWGSPGSAEVSAAPQLHTNSHVVREAQKFEEKKQEDGEKWLRIDTSKIIFGYMNTAMASGRSPSEAQVVALEAIKLQDEAVDAYLAQQAMNSK